MKPGFVVWVMYILSSGRRTYLIFLDAPIVFSCCWFSGFSNVFLILAEGCRGDSWARPPPSRRKPRHASGVPNPVLDPMAKSRPSRAAPGFPSRCGCQEPGLAQGPRVPLAPRCPGSASPQICPRGSPINFAANFAANFRIVPLFKN